MLTVITKGDPRLRLVAAPLRTEELADRETQAFIDELIKTMRAEKGVGIAAPQVATSKRLIVVTTKNGIEAFANPKIVSRSTRRVNSEEGCLSIPGVTGVVSRSASVKVKAIDRDGKRVLRKATGLEAVIFQHEIDHLDGILFTDRLEGPTRGIRL